MELERELILEMFTQSESPTSRAMPCSGELSVSRKRNGDIGSLDPVTVSRRPPKRDVPPIRTTDQLRSCGPLGNMHRRSWSRR